MSVLCQLKTTWRFYDKVIDKKNRAAIEKFIVPQKVDHTGTPGMQGGIKDKTILAVRQKL